MRLNVLLALATLAFHPARAQPLLDTAAVPRLDPAGRASYADFLLVNLPRAFAVGSPNAYGWHSGGTIETARAKALENCMGKGGTGCAIYAEDLDVVWQGRPAQVTPPPGPLISTWNYAMVPDNRYFWRDAAQAAGVYVWGHGFGGNVDARGAQPQGHVRAFNNAGFDVVRFDRVPLADADRNRAAGWLEDGLADLRRRGYRRIVVGGQSRGGWNSLQMLGRVGLADAVIAISPAAHGIGASLNLNAQYDDLRQLVNDVPPSRTRLAFVQFQADPFAGDLAGRRMLVERLRPKLGGLLVLDQPDGLNGHFGGANALFATRYGPCLLRFVMEATPPSAC